MMFELAPIVNVAENAAKPIDNATTAIANATTATTFPLFFSIISPPTFLNVLGTASYKP